MSEPPTPNSLGNVSRHRSRTISTNSHFSGDEHTAEFDITLEDSEMMELGCSHELVGDEMYLPSHPSRDWIRCFVSTSGSGSFRMYIEGRKKVRFLLSAKQFIPGGTIFISSSEEFPLLDNVPKKGFFARLQCQRDKSYMLHLNHCHLCDFRLGFFSCGRSVQEREVVARISHFYQRFREINLDYKCIKVQIPAISKSGKRKIWCPRAFKNSFSDFCQDGTIESFIKELDNSSMFCFKNELPEWNEDLGSLVVRFQGNRILTPSARNFLLVWCQNDTIVASSRSSSRSISPLQLRGEAGSGKSIENEAMRLEVRPKRSPSEIAIGHSIANNPQINSSNPSTPLCTTRKTNSFLESPKLRSRSNTMSSIPSSRRINSSGGEKQKDVHSEAVLQFGKSSPTRFTLDFRYPLSPLQAFGIALTSFVENAGNSDSIGDI